MKANRITHLLWTALLALLAACGQPPQSQTPEGSASPQVVGDIVVNSISDTDNDGCGDADCTLREAIGAAAPGNTITFSVSGTIPLGSTLTTNENLTIDATGQSITLDGQNAVRVLFNNATLTLTNLTITRGYGGGGSGGGIANAGNLTLNNSTVSQNRVLSGGGGIDNFSGTLTLNNSTVSGNTAGADGGGIANDGNLTLNNSTVSGNKASGGRGGGIANFNTLTLNNSTVSGNSAANAGGGITNFFALTLKNSIIANSTGEDCFNGGTGFTVTDQGYNLVENGTCVGQPTSKSGDPKLGNLADNGGPTFTHALAYDSPARNHIPSGTNGCGSDPTTDQRGVSRPQDNFCDIGAFELQPDTTSPVVTPNITGTKGSNDWYTSDVSVSWTVVDIESPISSQTGCNSTTINTDTPGATLTCTATSAGGTASQSVTIKRDASKPTCSASINPVSLWSPNHKLTNINTSVSVSDSGSGSDGFVLLSVSSSEADSGLGTDDVPGDIQGWVVNTPDTSGQLRSERYGKSGRTYTFTYQGKDKAGNTNTCKTSVSVPKSQK